jgi:hypothetical protein
MRTVLVALALIAAGPLQAAEDFRVMKLEQDMRNLERQVQTLDRVVNDLQQRARQASLSFGRNTDRAAQPADVDQTWLKSSAWNRVRTGMSELEVIEILGKPTALRPDASNRRALVYTMEIGTLSFLSGSVSFESGKAVAIQKPTLR